MAAILYRNRNLTPRDHLQRLWTMRNIALFGQVTVVLITQRLLHIPLPLVAILCVVSAQVVFNGLTWFRLQRVQSVSVPEIFFQFGIDLFALSVLLYFTGGATNPFVTFYLPILAVAAAALPAGYVWALSGFAVGAYTFMGVYYEPLDVGHCAPVIPLHQTLAHMAPAAGYHLIGMWVNFIIGASWIAWFVLRMSHDLRERDRALAAARQRLLQDARVVALAAQAARTAHELGTPLSSIAVAAGELAAACADDPALAPYAQDIMAIESQLEACRTTLYGLQEDTPVMSEDRVSLDEWLPHFIYQWRLAHPLVRLDYTSLIGAIECDAAVLLGQVLTIVLDNAARASEVVHVEARLAGSALFIVLQDEGAGVPESLRESLGSAPVRSPSGGRGWGLFLAFTAVEARGGSIRLLPGTQRGTRVEIRWPLAGAELSYSEDTLQQPLHERSP